MGPILTDEAVPVIVIYCSCRWIQQCADEKRGGYLVFYFAVKREKAADR